MLRAAREDIAAAKLRDPAARAGAEAKTLLLAPDGFSG